jgi:hypothetical protein
MRVALGTVGAVLERELAPPTTGAWDLSGVTVTLTAAPPGVAARTWTGTTATLVDGTQVIRYTTVSGDLNVAGVWTVRVTLTFGDGRVFPDVDPWELEVRP